MTATRRNVENGWLKCPHCGKKLFPVSNKTDVRHLDAICKMCKKEIKIKIEPAT